MLADPEALAEALLAERWLLAALAEAEAEALLSEALLSEALAEAEAEALSEALLSEARMTESGRGATSRMTDQERWEVGRSELQSVASKPYLEPEPDILLSVLPHRFAGEGPRLQ